MITQQNQGNDNNYFYFKQTESTDLINGFNSIVNGSYIKLESQDNEILSFEDAKNHVMNHKSFWNYNLAEKNADNIEVISTNEDLGTMRTDDQGSFYDVVIDTDDNAGTATLGGKQFRVYTDGRILQRVEMHEFYQIYP